MLINHSFFCLICTGYSDSVGYTSQRELAENNEDYYVEDEKEEFDEFRYVSKYGRVLTASDENFFVLFVETNLNRRITVVPNSNHDGVILTLFIPTPPDELIQEAGFHAVEMSFNHVEETFNIPTTSKITKPDKPIYWPNQETPLWIVFKFPFLIEQEDIPLIINTNLMEKLVKSNK